MGLPLVSWEACHPLHQSPQSEVVVYQHHSYDDRLPNYIKIVIYTSITIIIIIE